MPRQRKPQQSGVARAAGRVANTTTSWRDIWDTNPTVYRIPSWRARTECPAPLSEVGWVSPISVRREGNVFYVSLPEENLKNAIQSMDTLDLSNVTVSLDTINGPLTISGAITASGDITWQAINWTSGAFDSITSTTWSIQSISSTSITSDSVSTNTLSTTWSVSVGGTLWVAWATTLNSTLNVGWNIIGNADLSITWWTSTGTLTANSWTIATLVATSTTTNTVTVNNDATINWNLNVNGTSTLKWVNATDINASWNLSVTWTSNFTGTVSAWDLIASGTTSLNDVNISGNETVTGSLTTNGATTLNSSLTVAWATTMGGNASVAGNLSVAGNSTVTWNQTVTWDGIFSNDVSIAWDLATSGDVTITDDLSVNGTTHLKGVETDWSVDIDWTLRTSWAINAWNGVYVDGQVESDSLVTTNITTDNITINWNIALGNDATAPDFVLQDEKWQANGVAPLNVNWKIDAQYLPLEFPIPKIKVVQWVFNNSNTSVVVDEDITSDAWVKCSNYQDVVGDTTETISVGQITVVSNTVETGSFKVLIVRPIS